ncbi:hypothetical protein [Deinococcus budaensis]|uniref:Uncharacterized protein n=1 Tax=Deinococcus budaensis TaxID=1665626 RepID=A0A7W8GEQ9_9DEIO|nr:hypothetical protein [Deinococcus budaensis]MBB5234234.1 hypothetical protein [Deinococcus budaensis]
MRGKHAYKFHVSGALTVSADVTVIAASQEEAEAWVRKQLDLRASNLTNELQESAVEQVRKEMGSDEFEVELTEVREPTEDDEEA